MRPMNSENEKYIVNLESSRLLLRNILPVDKNFIIDLWTNPDVTKYMGGPRNINNLKLSIEDNINNPFQNEYDLWIVIDKSTQNPVGHCGLLNKKVEEVEEIEVVYVINKEFWGKGYATEIANVLIKYAFEEKKIDSVIALIKSQNEASVKVVLKAGIKLEKEVVRQENTKMLLFRKINNII